MRHRFLVACCVGVLLLHGRHAIDFVPIDDGVPSVRRATVPENADMLAPPTIPAQLDEWMQPAGSRYKRNFSGTARRPAWIELTGLVTFFCYWIHTSGGAVFRFFLFD